MPTLNQSQVYAIAVIVGMPEPKTMAAIAMAESSGRTDVVNSIGCVGLWQINQPVHVQAHPKWTQESLKNPINNALAARTLYEKGRGFREWEAYTNGAYKKFMDTKLKEGPVTGDELGVSDDQLNKVAAENMEKRGDGESLAEAVWDSVGEEIKDATGISAVEGAVDATGDVLISAWEAITTPAFWMRLAYGVTGAALVIGGLMLILRNTPVSKGATAMGEKIGNAATGGKGGAIKGAATGKGATS